MDNKQIQIEISTLKQRIDMLEKFVLEKKYQQISYPVDDVSRKTMGLGCISQKVAGAVSVGGYAIVDSNIGKIKVLLA